MMNDYKKELFNELSRHLIELWGIDHNNNIGLLDSAILPNKSVFFLIKFLINIGLIGPQHLKKSTDLFMIQKGGSIYYGGHVLKTYHGNDLIEGDQGNKLICETCGLKFNFLDCHNSMEWCEPQNDNNGR